MSDDFLINMLLDRVITKKETEAEFQSDTSCGVRNCQFIGIYEYSGDDRRVTPVLCAEHYAKRKHPEPWNWSLIGE